MKLNTRNKFTVLIAALLMMAILITGCSKTPKLSEGAVAMVNGTEISETEYNRLLDYYLSIARAQYDLTDEMLNKDEGTGMTLLDTLKADVLDTIILTEIIAKEAAENNIKVDEAEIQKLYEENHLKMMEEDEDYKKIIEENNLDEAFIKEQMKKDLLAYQYKVFYLGKIEMNDEAAKTFYDDNMEIFHSEEVKAKHIVVDDEQLAKDIIKKLEAGEDFEALAKEYSTEPAAQQSGGDLGYFGRGQMIPAFEEPVFNLEIGKISDPIKTEYGYHVVIVEDKKEETTEFEDVKEQIKSHLKEQDYQKHVEEALKKANIVKKEKL